MAFVTVNLALPHTSAAARSRLLMQNCFRDALGDCIQASVDAFVARCGLAPSETADVMRHVDDYVEHTTHAHETELAARFARYEQVPVYYDDSRAHMGGQVRACLSLSLTSWLCICLSISVQFSLS